MDGDNNIYGRYGSVSGRSSFLDSIPPFPWIRPENTAGHYSAPLDDPRLKQIPHYEDPRSKPTHIMEDPRLKLTPHMENPRLKLPVVMDDPRLKPMPLVDDPRFKPPGTTYPLFLDGTGVVPQTSRYYNEIQTPNQAIYSTSYDSHGQSPVVHYSSKDHPDHYNKESYRDQTMNRLSVYYTEHSKEPNVLYDNQCQYSSSKTTTSDPALGQYHENVRKGSLIGPFALGYAPAPYQAIVQNHGNNGESCPEEVIQKALVNHSTGQLKGAHVESKSSGEICIDQSIKTNSIEGKTDECSSNVKVEDDNANLAQDVNLIKDAVDETSNLIKHAVETGEKEIQQNSEATITDNVLHNEDDDDKTESYDESEISEPDEPIKIDKMAGCQENDKNDKTLDNNTSEGKQEKGNKDKGSKCIETQTVLDFKHAKIKQNAVIDPKKLAFILGKLRSKVRKSDESKCNEENNNSDMRKKNPANPSTRVIKIIKVFRDKRGKFTKRKSNNCAMKIQKVYTGSGSTDSKDKTTNDKVIIKNVKCGSKVVSTFRKFNKNETKKSVRISERSKSKRETQMNSDTDEDMIVQSYDNDKDINNGTKPFPEPKVIVVKPPPSSKNAKLLSDEEPTAYINNNESYTNTSVHSLATLPHELFLGASANSEHGIGVFCKKDIQRGTRMGPLQGEKVMFQDLSPAADFTHIWCFSKDDDWRDIELVDTANDSQSNWCRYIRSSLNSNCNLIRLKKDNQLYFMSSRDIQAGEELVYYLRYFGGDSTGPHHSACFPEKQNEDENSSHCAHCKISLSNANNYIKHCQIYHTTGSAKTRSHCRLCNAVFLSRRELKKHSKQFHSGHGGEFTCAICGKTYVYQTDLKEHMKLTHYEQPTECDECGKMLLNPKKLQAHKQRAHSRQTFACEKCGKVFTQNSVLQRHKMIHDEIYSVACDRCGKLFRDKHNLKVHLLTHSGVKPFECSIQGCTAAFTVKQCLQGHYRKVHGYTDFNMPPISRSVPFTPDAYMGHQEDMNAIQSLKL